MARPHNNYFAFTFSDPRAAMGELQSVLPKAIADAIDWTTLRVEQETFVDETLRDKHSDLVFSVQLAGHEARIFVLFEHQSRGDRFMVVRFLMYTCRFWERWLKQNPDADRLPPVIPLLLSQVEGGWQYGTTLHEVLDIGDGAYRDALLPLLPSLSLTLIDDVMKLDDATLDARPLPLAAKLALAAFRDLRGSTDFVATVRTLVEKWSSKLDPDDAGDMSAKKAFMAYAVQAQPSLDVKTAQDALQLVVRESEEIIMTTIQELIDAGQQRGRADGLLEGEARGKAEGKVEALRTLLTARFGALDAPTETRLSAATIEALDRWIPRVLTAASLDDVFADG